MRLYLVLLAACSGGLRAGVLRFEPTFTRSRPATVWRQLLALPTDRFSDLLRLFAPLEPHGGVTLTGDRVFTATGGGAFAAYDWGGHLLWRGDAGEALSLQPLLVGEMVILGTHSGHVLAVRAATGVLVWTQTLTGVITAAAAADGRLFLTSSNNQVTALDVLTGKWLWRYDRGQPLQLTVRGQATPVIDGSSVYVGFSDGALAALHLHDGQARWTRQLTLSAGTLADADITPLLVDGTLYAASVSDGVFALANDGRVLWQLRVSHVTRLASSAGRLFALSSTGSVYRVDPRTGDLLWTRGFPAGEVTAASVTDTDLTFGAWPGGLFVLDAETGVRQQRFFVGGVASDLASFQHAVAFLSEDNIVYLLCREGERCGG